MEILKVLLVFNIVLMLIVIVSQFINKKKYVANIYSGLDHLEDDEYFSKAVKEYYNGYIKEPNKYTTGSCIVKRCNDEEKEDIVIWASNDIDSRKFYTHSKDLEVKVKELNSKLTHFDKVLLDKLCNSVKNRTSKIEQKIFF